MDKPHKQVITSYPVAIKYGQSRLHVASPIPWHAHSEAIKCPKCETVYIVTSGFPRVELLQALEEHHENQKEHPDHIASAPEWTHLAECNCHL
jgi:hypothetical protein